MTTHPIDKATQGFTGPLLTEQLSDGRNMRLLDDFGYVDDKGVLHLAPADFIYDGGSIPRFLWRLIGSPFTGKARKAYPIHDYERAEALKIEDVDRREEVIAYSDATLHDICEFVGVRRWRRRLMYVGIRAFAILRY